MAKSIHEISITRPAAENLNQHRAVRIDSNGDAATPNNAGDFVVGVAKEGVGSSGHEVIQIYGVAEMEAGESVNQGDEVAADANGKAVTAQSADVDTTTSNADESVNGSQVLGVAIDGAGGDGEKCSVLLTHAGAIARNETNSE